MAAYDDAIEATGRVEQVRAIIYRSDGQQHPIVGLCTGVSVDRSVSDQPESVTQVAGTAGAQARIQLAAAGTVIDPVTSLPISIRAQDLSPLSTHAWSTRNQPGYGIGWNVAVYHDLWVSGSWSSVQVFSGTVRTFGLDDDGGASLLCQDASATLRGTLNLPAAGYVDTSGGPNLDPLGVVDLALRSAGIYLTPPPRSGAILSVPGVGAPLPEVGSFRFGMSVGWQQSPWPTQVPEFWAAGWSEHDVTVLPKVGQYVTVEGWFMIPAGGGPLVSLFSGNGGAAGQVDILVMAGNTGIQIDAVGISVAAAVTTPDVYTYVGLSWQVGNASTATLRVGSSSYSIPAMGVAAAASRVVGTHVIASGIQVWVSDALNTTWNDGWTPARKFLYPAWPTYWIEPQWIGGIRATPGLSPWQTIKEVAAAYGDLAFFDVDGAFRYMSRSEWRAKRFGTAKRTLTGDRVLSGAPEWTDQSVRQSVSAAYTQPQTKVSTATAPAWVATDVYTCPARSTRTYDVELDYSVIAIAPFLGGHQTDANSSWIFAIDASMVGDPAATRATGVTPTVEGTATGLRITIRNPLNYAVALWTPGDGGSIPAGPYLVVHGTTVTVPEPTRITVNTGAADGGDLPLDDNTWRQDATLTLAYANEIAADLAMPQVMVQTITIPADPRLVVGDVVSVLDSRYMDVALPFQVIGVAHDMTGDMHTTALTVRACYPPTGWILDVPGRSELDSTTILVA